MKKFMNVIKTIVVAGAILFLAVLVRLPDLLDSLAPSGSSNYSSQSTVSAPTVSLSPKCREAKNILLLRIKEAKNPNGVMGLYVAKAAFDEALKYAAYIDGSYNCRGTLNSAMRDAEHNRERVAQKITILSDQHTW